MATPKKTLNDGIIDGTIEAKGNFCGNCNEPTWCVTVKEITLPAAIAPSYRLIAYGTAAGPEGVICIHHRYLGIGCGCYAKFHRQLAHIEDRMKRDQ